MPIGVHVLGPGYGETIVLDLPDNSLGVVDTYRQREGRFPALDFIRNGLPGPRRSLRFLAVTHPHSDHCCGITQLSEAVSVGEWWVYDSLPHENVREFFRQLVILGAIDAVDDALRLPPGTISLETLRLYDRVMEHARRPDAPTPRLLKVPEAFDLCDGQVRIVILAPGIRSCLTYGDAIGRSLKSMTKDGRTVSPDWSPSQVCANLISASILIEYGATRILLSGDAQVPLWEEWDIDRAERPGLDVRTVHFLKIGHHGSQNGYFRPLYERVCGSQTTAVLTPFARGQKPLPSRDGVQQIAHHTTNIYTTNRFVSSESSRFAWRAENLPALPTQWVADIANQPELRSLLAPELNTGRAPSPGGRLPRHWHEDCRTNPQILSLLHPDLREVKVILADSPPQDVFRFSAYYDTDGNELTERRFTGAGVGKVVLE